MDVDGFWELIDRSRAGTGTVWQRTSWLEERLRCLPAGEIVDFEAVLDRLRRRADTWDLLAAHDVITDGCGGGDLYFYFLHWLIGQGRQQYEQVVACADALAENPHIRTLAGRHGQWTDEEYPDWEGLLSVAAYAYAAVTGTQISDYNDVRGLTGSLSDPDTRGTEWDLGDPQELARRLPRLRRLVSSPPGSAPQVEAGS